MTLSLPYGPLLSCLLLVLTAGCAPVGPWLPRREMVSTTVQQPAPFEGLFSRKGKIDDLLLYFQLVREMAAPQQEKEFEQAKADFSSGGRPEDRMRLALLSLLPGRTPADRNHALTLVEDYLAVTGEKSDLDGLAFLLRQVLADQRTLQRKASAEKERGDALARQLNEQKTQLEEHRKQLEESKKQLEELKKIEKIISDRERKGLPEKRQ
jgi:hypothetical protein